MTATKHTMTIQMDPNTAAYYRGIAAGAQAQDMVSEVVSQAKAAGEPAVPKATKIRLYWLQVGRYSMDPAKPKLSGDSEALALFVQGAGLRAP